MKRPRGSVAAVIPAAGWGKRMGGSMPKQFLRIQGKPLLIHTLEAFERCERIDTVILIVSDDQIEAARTMLDTWCVTKVGAVVPGGEERQESVRHGLEALKEDAVLAVIHDGVRPLVTPELITKVIDAADKSGAAILAVPVRDTVKKGTDMVERTLDRKSLWLVQTPQVFRTDWIVEAYRSAEREGFETTDDAALVERMGHTVHIVAGDPSNFKVTSQADLRLAELILERSLR